jgi:hypothetical protein
MKKKKYVQNVFSKKEKKKEDNVTIMTPVGLMGYDVYRYIMTTRHHGEVKSGLLSRNDRGYTWP